MTVRIGHLGPENRGRTSRTGQPEQDSRDMEQDQESRGRTATVEWPGQERQIRRGVQQHDIKVMTAVIGQQGQFSLDKSA
jgi:hypothetical protein